MKLTQEQVQRLADGIVKRFGCYSIYYQSDGQVLNDPKRYRRNLRRWIRRLTRE